MESRNDGAAISDAARERRGIRLLSLDGGGVRGLSSLYILRYLMKQIDSENPPKPCDYFDLIGGTSTGGLIAIMLGRLQMDISECITVYKELSKKVFTPKRSRMNLLGKGKDKWTLAGAFDAEVLEQEIDRIVESKGFSKSAKLMDGTSRCRVFVCAIRAETTTLARLRSYQTRTTVDEVECTITQAARATSAASTFFMPVEIDGQQFVDGATAHNNPVNEVLQEAHSVWPNNDPAIERFVSIGTGIPSLIEFGSSLKKVVETLKAISTDTERVAQQFQNGQVRAHGLNGIYFRFNVSRGLQSISLEEHSKQGAIIAATNTYLEEFETARKVQEFVTGPKHILSPVNKVAYLNTLFSYDVQAELQITRTPVGSTFQWIFESQQWKEWARGDRPIFSIRGKPGCGKSVLLAFLRRSMESSVAFFACKDGDQRRRLPEMILSSLLHQILSSQPNLFRYVVPLERHFGDWSYEQLLESMRGVLTSPDNVGIVCMLDALDECDFELRKRFVRDLRDIFDRTKISKDGSGYRRMIIASRSYPELTFPQRMSVALNLDASPFVQTDLSEFISWKVSELLDSRTEYQHIGNRNITKVLESRANGMYRLVELLMNELESTTDSSAISIQRTLQSVPSHLGAMYNRIWNRISIEQQPRARKIMMVILSAVTPLTRDALKTAIAILDLPQDKKVRLPLRNQTTDLVGDLERLFGPLIEINSHVQVSHHSVKDYFLEKPTETFGPCAASKINFSEAHVLSASICLRYLNSESHPIRNSDQDFLEYAQKFWAKHTALIGGGSSSIDRGIYEYFEADVWVASWKRASPSPHNMPSHPKPQQMFLIDNVLSFAAYYNRPNLVRDMVVKAHSGYVRRPELCYASSAKSSVNADDTNHKLYLVSDSAKSFSASSTPDAAPQWRCMCNVVEAIYLSIVSMNKGSILNAIVALDMVDINGWSAEEHEAIALTMSEAKEEDFGNVFDHLNDYFHILHNFNTSASDIRTQEDRDRILNKVSHVFEALCPESFYRDEEGEFFSANTSWLFIFALISGLYLSWVNGNKSNSIIRHNSKIVLSGAKWNRLNVVKLLLDEGAGLEARDENGATALHLAAATGNTELVRTILERRQISVDACDDRGNSPLHYACRAHNSWEHSHRSGTRPKWVSRCDVIELLLKHGAAPRAQNMQGNSPFQDLSRMYVPDWPHIPYTSELNWRQQDLSACINLLIRGLDDVLRWDSYGATPLHYASYLWPISAIEQLLQYLGNYHLSGLLLDSLGATPLHYAATRGFDQPEKVIRVLYAAGVDSRVRNIFGETAMQTARIYGRKKAFRALSSAELEDDQQAQAFSFSQRKITSRVPGVAQLQSIPENNRSEGKNLKKLSRKNSGNVSFGENSVSSFEFGMDAVSSAVHSHPSIEFAQSLARWKFEVSHLRVHFGIQPAPSRTVLSNLSLMRYDVLRIPFGAIHSTKLIRPLVVRSSSNSQIEAPPDAESDKAITRFTSYIPKIKPKSDDDHLDTTISDDTDSEDNNSDDDESSSVEEVPRHDMDESKPANDDKKSHTNSKDYAYVANEWTTRDTQYLHERMKKLSPLGARFLMFDTFFAITFSHPATLAFLFGSFSLGAPWRPPGFRRHPLWDYGDRASTGPYAWDDSTRHPQPAQHQEGLVYGWIDGEEVTMFSLKKLPTIWYLLVIFAMSYLTLVQVARLLMHLGFHYFPDLMCHLFEISSGYTDDDEFYYPSFDDMAWFPKPLSCVGTTGDLVSTADIQEEDLESVRDDLEDREGESDWEDPSDDEYEDNHEVGEYQEDDQHENSYQYDYNETNELGQVNEYNDGYPYEHQEDKGYGKDDTLAYSS